MAFLDNSGDIILDAVLTDEGRRLLARGDGSFKITKFALGDDEINYGLYDKNDPSGSAYYDLEILQSPILEAFTNNASSMKNKLITLSRNDFLYLPIIKLNEKQPSTKRTASGASFAQNMFLVTVDKTTEDSVSDFGTQGLIRGSGLGGTTNFVRCDQGLDTSATEISPARTLSAELVESSYIVEIDNRLGKIVNSPPGNGAVNASLSFIDDDNVATYMIDGSQFVEDITNTDVVDETNDQTLSGPRGTRLQFSIAASDDLFSSEYFFDLLGSSQNSVSVGGQTMDVKFIDTTVRVTGMSTGYRLDVPVRFVKKV